MTWEIVMSRFPVVHAGGEEEDEGDVDKKSSEIEVKSSLLEAAAPTVVQGTHRGIFSRPNPLFKSLS
jgi:hypothetical protein